MTNITNVSLPDTSCVDRTSKQPLRKLLELNVITHISKSYSIIPTVLGLLDTSDVHLTEMGKEIAWRFFGARLDSPIAFTSKIRYGMRCACGELHRVSVSCVQIVDLRHFRKKVISAPEYSLFGYVSKLLRCRNMCSRK
jgi:hypothetical protein